MTPCLEVAYAVTEDRRDRDDAAGSSGHHRRERRTDRAVGPVEVDVDDARPRALVLLGEEPRGAEAGARDERVETIELSEGPLGHRDHVGRSGDVGPDGEGIRATQRARLVRDGLDGVIDVAEDQRGALPRERDRDRASDAAARAGHRDGLTLQTHGRLVTVG